jgi:hypothetical protein
MAERTVSRGYMQSIRERKLAIDTEIRSIVLGGIEVRGSRFDAEDETL